jgi:histidinol-phosphate aminotransferase
MVSDRARDDLVRRWIRPEIRALTAYHVSDASGLIKLDAMENPYGWPPEMVAEWLETVRGAPINRYPDAGGTALKAALRQAMHIPDDMDLLLGNGSDELIQVLALALAAPGRVVIAPEPTFVMYRLISTYAGMSYLGIPLLPDFSLDLPALLQAIADYQPALVFLAYPNNPTGNLFDEDAVRTVIAASPGPVIVDEAYHVFAGRNLLGALREYPNLLVLRTLSKMGLAGLRLGFLVGSRDWIAELDKVRLPYNINVLTQLSAAFALRHTDVLETQAAAIRTERERVYAAISEMPGLTVYLSRANFLLFRAPEGRGCALFQALRAAGILIKNLHGSSPALRDCLRVTVGTPQENAAFLKALSAGLASSDG